MVNAFELLAILQRRFQESRRSGAPKHTLSFSSTDAKLDLTLILDDEQHEFKISREDFDTKSTYAIADKITDQVIAVRKREDRK